jgi:hypothetical protein
METSFGPEALPVLLKTRDLDVITQVPPAYGGYLVKKDSYTGASTVVGGGATPTPSLKASTSALEKGTVPWAGYEDDELPEKTQGHYLRNLRHLVFSLYRRLFGIVFVTNAAIFIVTCARHKFQSESLGLAVVVNLFCAVLMRQVRGKVCHLDVAD